MKHLLLLLMAVAIAGSPCWAKRKIGKEHYEEVDGDQRFIVGGAFNVVDRALSLPLQPKWQADLGGVVFDLARREGQIIAMAETGVHAVDPVTGKTLWHYGHISGMPSAPQIGDGIVYFSTFAWGKKKSDPSASTIHVLDLNTGEARWTYETSGGQFAALSQNGSFMHAVLTSPNIWDAEEGHLKTFDATDGSLLWEKDIAEGDWKFNHAIGSHGVVAVARKKPYEFNLGGVGKLMRFAAKFEATSWTYGILAFDAQSGRELWTRKVEGKLPLPTQVKHLQVTSDGVLFPLLGRGSEDPEGTTFGLPFAVDIKTGTPVWEQKTWGKGGDDEIKHWANAGYVVEDRYIYGQGIGDEGKKTYMMCADLKNGEMLWREDADSGKLGKFMKGLWNKTVYLTMYDMPVTASSLMITDPRSAMAMGDALSIFTHYGMFVSLPGENKVKRYVGGKDLWSADYKMKKKEVMLMPKKITQNYVPIGDTSGKVSFFTVRKGKTNKKEDINLGGALYHIRVDDDLILFAAENGLHAY